MSEGTDSTANAFFTPKWFAGEIERMAIPPRGRLLIAGCSSGSYLSSKVAERYRELTAEAGGEDDMIHLEDMDRRFSDEETCVRIPIHVGGFDVYLFQALFDPTSERSIDQNYMAFLIAARAFREHGAKHITGVLPYLAYARQDKPTKFTREPTTARLMADLSIASGVDRLIVWDPHAGQIRGFYGSLPVHMLESLTLFIEEFDTFKDRQDAIVVAPDVGASKFVTHFGRALNIKSAIATKYRPKPEVVVVSEIIGDFSDKKVAILLDDMVSSGGTIFELVKKLVDEQGIEEVYLGVSHNLCVGCARDHLETLHSDYNLKQVVVTNSIPQTQDFKELPYVKVKCLSDTLARTINRIHYDRSVSEVFYRPKGSG
jgi:ribose-phosphate pyrophosphokinase